MKKIIAATLVFACLFPATITINKDYVAVRNLPMPMEGTKQITNVMKGQVLTIIGTYADYVKVEVIAGTNKKTTSDNVGKVGYVWVERLDQFTNTTSFIVKEGVCIRSTPEKTDDNLICKIKVNSTVKIIDSKVTWYNTSLGWIYAGLVTVNK